MTPALTVTPPPRPVSLPETEPPIERLLRVQAEGVASMRGVPATGCLVEIGFPKFGGGVGGYARFIAICPPSTRRGVRIGGVPEAPLRKYSTDLHWDTNLGMRVR